MFFACRHLLCFQTAESVVNCPTSDNLLLGVFLFAEDSVTKCSIMFEVENTTIISVRKAMLVRMNQDKIYQLKSRRK
jgi:hypothetical protein